VAIEARQVDGAPAGVARALRDAVRAQRTEMAAVFRMVETLAATLDLERLLAYVVRLCAEVAGCAGALVYLWDEDRERLVVRAAVEGYERWIGRFSLAMGEGLTGWTALTRQPGIIRDNPTADPRFLSVPELNDDRFQSCLTIPIVAPDERLVGVLTLHSEAPHEFRDDDLAIMETISALIGVAVDNAQLYERQRRQVSVLHALSDASQALVQTASLRHLMHRLASTAGSLIGGDLCAVLTLDDAHAHLTVEATWTPDAGSLGIAPPIVDAAGPWGRLTGLTEPAVLSRRDDRDVFEELDEVIAGARVALVAPMRVGDRPIGAFLCAAVRPRPFGREDRELLGMLASQAALAVQNARLIEALTERDAVRDLFEALALGEDGALGIERRASRLGVDLTRPHVVAVFELGGEATSDVERIWFALRHDLTGELPGSLLAHRDHTLTGVLRLPAETDPARLAARIAELKRAHEKPPASVISVGVSRVCRSLEDYPGAFDQAREALTIGRVVRGPGAVVPFDELGAQRHLFAVAREGTRDAFQERLERLIDHDRARGSQLFRTVETYLECMGNAKLAAERLFVHRNTLRQRLDKVRRVAGIDLGDPAQWFDLMMAVRVIRLRASTGGSAGALRRSSRRY
jgi:GAF domain-containing protein